MKTKFRHFNGLYIASMYKNGEKGMCVVYTCNAGNGKLLTPVQVASPFTTSQVLINIYALYAIVKSWFKQGVNYAEID